MSEFPEYTQEQLEEMKKRGLTITREEPDQSELDGFPDPAMITKLLNGVKEADKKLVDAETKQDPEKKKENPEKEDAAEEIRKMIADDPKIKSVIDTIIKKRKNKEDTLSVDAFEHACPNCGWNDIRQIPPGELTEADKEEWVRCLFAGPFVKEFVLMKGKLKIRYRTKSKKVLDLINNILIKEAREGKFPKENQFAFVVAQKLRQTELNLVASLVGVNDTDYPDITSKEAEELYGVKGPEIFNAATAHMFDTLGEYSYSLLLKYCNVFENLCFRLTDAMSSPDFFPQVEESA